MTDASLAVAIARVFFLGAFALLVYVVYVSDRTVDAASQRAFHLFVLALGLEAAHNTAALLGRPVPVTVELGVHVVSILLAVAGLVLLQRRLGRIRRELDEIRD